MEKIVLLVIAVGLAYAVGCWGRTRKIGIGCAIALSLVNLLIGIIAVACSKKNDEKLTKGDKKGGES